jgi:chemotaxis protein methyltransferase CheR
MLFVHPVATNLTSFFREGHHFEDVAGASGLSPRSATLRIWCNAASTGEEPYSIAMTVAETLGAGSRQVSLLATDIDTKVLAKAQRAVYDAASPGLSAERLKQHFLRVPAPTRASSASSPTWQEWWTSAPSTS